MSAPVYSACRPVKAIPVISFDRAKGRSAGAEEGQARRAEGRMKVVGSIYEIETGRVRFLDPARPAGPEGSTGEGR